MYVEKKAFPVKYLIMGAAALVFVIVLVVLLNSRPDYEQMRRDKISRIIAAGIEYGEDHEEDFIILEEGCISIETLIEAGLLVSDSKDENVLYDPTDRTSKTLLDNDVFVYYADEFMAEYNEKDECAVDYTDMFSVIVTNKTSSNATVNITIPSLLNVDKIEMTNVDEEEYFDTQLSTKYTFSELKAGKHVVKIKVTSINSKDIKTVYSFDANFTIDEIDTPIIALDEVSSDIVVINYPSMKDENSEVIQTFEYFYLINTEDETNKEITEDEIATYQFTESGYIIAGVFDGINTVKSEKFEITVIPPCEDTEWTTCSGCTATCGTTCEGTQTSNCGTVRPCTVTGYCEPVIETNKYDLTINVKNGTPEVTNVEIEEGKSYTLTDVRPYSGYVYSKASCTSGKISYSSSSKKATISGVKKNATCTVTFTKQAVTTNYTVTFVSAIDGNKISTKTVKKGGTVTAPTPPTITGYTFSKWTLNGATYNFSSSVNSNITIVAQYTKNSSNANKIQVTFNPNNGGSLQYRYVTPGALVTPVSNPTYAGSHFVQWNYNNAKFNFSTPITAPITLVASWVPLSIFSFDISCASAPCTQTVTIPNMAGIDEVYTTKGRRNYTISGNSVTVTLTEATSATISIAYYK